MSCAALASRQGILGALHVAEGNGEGRIWANTPVTQVAAIAAAAQAACMAMTVELRELKAIHEGRLMLARVVALSDRKVHGRHAARIELQGHLRCSPKRPEGDARSRKG